MTFRFGCLIGALVLAGCTGGGEPLTVEEPGPAARQLPAPTAPPQALEPVAVERWMTGYVRSGGGDPVLPRVEDGSFTLPAEGLDEDGIEWFAVTPGEEGGLGPVGRGVLWAATVVRVEEPTGLVMRADRALTGYVNGERQPGDVYGSGRIRVPFALEAGENLVVVRALGGRGEPKVQLWTTGHEVVFNLEDLTFPHLRVGDASTQYLGVPLLEMTGRPLGDLTARVLESDHFEESALELPGLPPAAVTQVPFELRPKAAFEEADATVPVRLRVESPSAFYSYETEVELSTVAADGTHYRRTFRSGIDGSAQYYGVRPPEAVDPEASYALVLSLHGASVEAIGQARAYASKDWAYVVAPTNRRPFGFDWEDWGRLDGLEVLEDAKRVFAIDETRVHVTGHSMGGHGTWQLGSLFPGRFAVVGPSAGWASFYSYTGRARPTGPFARSQASSDTYAYLSNLQRRSVYVVHGDADDNVPVRESRDLVAMLEAMDVDVTYHEEPGAGHWWNGDVSEGTDCVDWPPMFDLMRATTLDPIELDFDFVSPSPFVSPTHSYVTLQSAETPYEDLRIASTVDGDTVTLETENVRSLTLDGAALAARGVATVVVDGEAMPVEDGPMAVGPASGKRLGQHGPFNEALSRPFCFVYPDEGPETYRRYASYLTSTWAVRGNGLACALPASRFSAAVAEDYQPVYLGVRPEGAELPFAWEDGAVTVATHRFEGAAVAFVQPEGDGVAAYVATAPGHEELLWTVMPFSSGSALPDYLVWTDRGGAAAGFFDAEWAFDESLGAGF
jgi:poly(3-hydroxybutyrate) depolymerase